MNSNHLKLATRMGWRESINDDIGIKPYFLEKAEKALVQFQAILPSFLVN